MTLQDTANAAEVGTLQALLASWRRSLRAANKAPRTSDTGFADAKPVFWFEAIALWAFGIAWFVKGEGLKRLNDQVSREP